MSGICHTHAARYVHVAARYFVLINTHRVIWVNNSEIDFARNFVLHGGITSNWHFNCFENFIKVAVKVIAPCEKSHRRSAIVKRRPS